MSLSLKRITLHNFRGIHGTLKWQFHDQPGFYFVAGQNLKEPTLGANGAGKSTIFVDAPYWILTGKTILSQRPGNSIENWDLDKGSIYGELSLSIDGAEYTIRRGRSPSVLTINERTVEQREIDRLIPLSDSAMRRTLLLGQRSSMFLDLRPEEKSRLFVETLDLDIWLRAATLAGERLRDKEKQATIIDNKFSSVTGSMSEVRDQHEAATIKEEEFTTAHKERVQTLIASGKQETDTYDALKLTLDEATARLTEISKGNASEDELRTRRARERTLRDEKIKLDAERAQLVSNDEKLTLRIAAYNPQSKTCPECGQPVTVEHAHSRRTALMTEQQTASDRLKEVQQALSQIELQLPELVQSIVDLEESNKNIIDLKANIKTLEQQVIAQERHCVRIVNDIQKAETEINPFSALCDELEARYHKLNDEREALIAQEEAIIADIEVLKFWQKGYHDIRLEQIDTTLLELELATNRNATALGLQDWEIQFATERETKSGSVSHAFSIFLFPPGQSKPVSWDSYSGGEAQRWQLAVTFGLSEVLLSRAGVDPDIEILDEPTSFLSQEGIDDLLECLHARAHELQRRIYLIDHRSLERGSFDGIVTVIKDAEGVRIER